MWKDGGGVGYNPDVHKRNFLQSSYQSPTPRPLVHERPDHKVFCVSDVFTHDTIWRPSWRGLPGVVFQTDDGDPKSQFLVGCLWWMIPNKKIKDPVCTRKSGLSMILEVLYVYLFHKRQRPNNKRLV